MSRGCYCDPGTCTHFDEVIPWDPFLKEWWELWARILKGERLTFVPNRIALRELVPKVELTVDVSRLGESLALSSDDASVYGTSGELDPRGYWVPDVG